VAETARRGVRRSPARVEEGLHGDGLGREAGPTFALSSFDSELTELPKFYEP